MLNQISAPQRDCGKPKRTFELHEGGPLRLKEAKDNTRIDTVATEINIPLLRYRLIAFA